MYVRELSVFLKWLGLCLLIVFPYTVQAVNVDIHSAHYVNHKALSKNWLGKDLLATEKVKQRCTLATGRCDILVTPALVDEAQPQQDGEDFSYGMPFFPVTDYLRVNFTCDGAPQPEVSVPYGYRLTINCNTVAQDRVKKEPDATYTLSVKGWAVTKERFVIVSGFVSSLLWHYLSSLEVGLSG